MIRWYDWAIALLLAYLAFPYISLAITGPVWYLQLIGACVVYLAYDLWIDYCDLRKKLQRGK